MQKINSRAGLLLAIDELEIVKAEQGKMLKEQFHLAYESVQPINLIKNTLKEAIVSPGLKEGIVNNSVGLLAGVLSRILFVNVSRSPVRKILGAALQFGITNVVTKNPEAFKSIGRRLMNSIGSKLTSRTKEMNGSESN